MSNNFTCLSLNHWFFFFFFSSSSQDLGLLDFVISISTPSRSTESVSRPFSGTLQCLHQHSEQQQQQRSRVLVTGEGNARLSRHWFWHQQVGSACHLVWLRCSIPFALLPHPSVLHHVQAEMKLKENRMSLLRRKKKLSCALLLYPFLQAATRLHGASCCTGTFC